MNSALWLSKRAHARTRKTVIGRKVRDNGGGLGKREKGEGAGGKGEGVGGKGEGVGDRGRQKGGEYMGTLFKHSSKLLLMIPKTGTSNHGFVRKMEMT